MQVSRLKRLGALVRQRRRQRGMTQEELGRAAGRHKNTVVTLENGRKISAASLDDVAFALGWPPGAADAFLRGDDAALDPSSAALPAPTPAGIIAATASELVRVRALIEEVSGRDAADRWLQQAMTLREQARPASTTERTA